MYFDQLKEKALTLPYSPGVYIMKDKSNQVIYVGKAKKLKNRVCQYFQDTASHSLKTKLMVAKIHNFDVIVADSEFEALVLECSLIKRHQPKYNILLKDDKGYPYIRLDMNQRYPVLSIANKVSDDGAGYYGPFGSRGVTNNILESIRLALRIPSCNKKFPRDIGKDRPCLHYHMNQCRGWCQPGHSEAEYRKVMEQSRQLLLGKFKGVAGNLKEQMLAAADELNFELAASLRDQLNAVEALGNKQFVTAGANTDTDVIGYWQTDVKACFAVLHFSGGNLLDKDYEILNAQEDPENAVSALLKQYYLSRGFAPKVILLPFEIEDSDVFSQLLAQQYNKKVNIKVPQRGENVRLLDLAIKNAREEAVRITDANEQISASVSNLGKMLGCEPPARIEAFDISNISGTDIVASMVVFQDGNPHRSEYKHFKINDLPSQDDYASMHQVITRRFTHFVNQDKGFEKQPDLILIDGGAVHAKTATDALSNLNLKLNVFGMVKDDRHRTRALVTSEGEEIRIDSQQSAFSLIGCIQEETHRFAINYHRKLRSKRLRYSQLDKIPGIGPKRKEELLKTFKSLTAIASATLIDLEMHLPKDVAMAVYKHFRTEGKESDK